MIRRRLPWLMALLLLFVLLFVAGKIAFMAYNSHNVSPFGLTDVMQVVAHGFSMDLSTSAYLVSVPWLCALVSVWWGRMPLRGLMLPYFIVAGVLLSLILVGDTVMYGFWKFKLDSTVIPYLTGGGGGAAASVSPLFLVSGVAAVLILAAVVAYVAARLTPRRLRPVRHRVPASLLMVLVGGCLFMLIRGGVRQSTMNVGVAYYSPVLFLNHAAVNPAFSLISSVSKNKAFDRQFRFLDDEERARTFNPLYATSDTEGGELTDSLLRVSRPNVLVVIMESFGGKFIRELGGEPDVAPNFSRLIPQGVFFTNFYANSFRTDRGTVSLLSGWVSYPTVSLMRIPGRTATLPSIARSLGEAGYQCDYIYGGDIKIMGKKGYLVATGYSRLTSIADFPLRAANESKWGVNDSLTARRAYEMIASRPDGAGPWHTVLQTLSSHEPYKVPYKRFPDNEVLNAFAFTDECVGHLVDSLRTLPQWDNMLVVLLPDHNSTYQATYQDPEFFHCPMLWLGGAIREPREISVLMNQSDLAATLLAQMGLPYTGFPWSRNVLGKGYTYPFAYSSYPGGIVFRDSTGVTVFDTASRQPVTERGDSAALRLRRAQSILQTSYEQLSER